jgi:hypothetical protein
LAINAVLMVRVENFKTPEDLESFIKSHQGKVTKVVDGAILKGCDHLAAFVEAYLSIEHGITSIHLKNGVQELSTTYKGKIIGGVDFGSIYAEFKHSNTYAK